MKCVACFLCATACPAHCIDILAAESPWPDRQKYPQSFTIDELRCIYCGMCEEACPVDAIELTSLYDLSGKSREEMIFDKEKLLSVYDQTKDAEPMKSRQPGPAEMSAAENTRSRPVLRRPPVSGPQRIIALAILLTAAGMWLLLPRGRGRRQGRRRDADGRGPGPVGIAAPLARHIGSAGDAVPGARRA